MKPEISIVIPAFEEEERLGRPLQTILSYITVQKLAAEVIVVDDGSGDSTAKTAESIFNEHPLTNSRVIRYDKNRGKGYAVRTGLEAASAPIALFSDADLSTPISEMPKLIDPIRNGEFDLTFGSRALDRSLIGTHQPWRREQGGKLINQMIKRLAGLQFWDTQCGFKAFNLEKFGPLLKLMQIDRFGFDVEFLYVASMHGLKLKEIPVRWDNDERSKVHPVRDTWRMLNELRQIRRNATTGIYDNQGS